MPQRRWIWYYVVLVILAAIAVATPWVINARQQLTEARVAKARALWRQHGPRDYNLEYTQQVDVEPRDTFKVEVRRGKVIAARCNGQPTMEPVWTIDAMFDYIETALLEDREAGQRNYTVADFDPTDGRPIRYVRRVRSTHNRLEWRVRLERVTAC